MKLVTEKQAAYDARKTEIKEPMKQKSEEIRKMQQDMKNDMVRSLNHPTIPISFSNFFLLLLL